MEKIICTCSKESRNLDDEVILIITFRSLNEPHLELVLGWRVSPHVTQYMYTDIKNDIKHQQDWFGKIKNDRSQQHWIIEYKDVKIGVISLSKIDLVNKSATSGFYIGDLQYSMISSRILPYFLNYVFFEKDLNKLYIEVMSSNRGMIEMDLHYGFRHVGTLEKHVYKNGEFHDVEVLELLQDNWFTNYKKYHSLKAIIKGEEKSE